jgi:signal transduction histidine kinase
VSQGAGAARWLTIHDELLRGLAHALSNRVATIDAATYMLGLEGADVAGHTATLRGETERLEAVLYALRALVGHDGGAEPVMPGDAVQGALALHAHHGDLRDIPCDVAIDPAVPPAYADPVALQHALLVAVTAARRAAGAGGRVSLRVSSTTDVVEFFVDAVEAVDHAAAVPAGAGHDDGDAEAIDWLLGAHGGRSAARSGGRAFTVPTLTAARKAERGAAGRE